MFGLSLRRPHRRYRFRPSIEQLESREVPATLVSPTTLTYQDTDGDVARVVFSKPILTPGNVNSIFTFDMGNVNGNNATKQQLQKIDLTIAGQAAQGMTLTVNANRSPVNGGNGLANLGYVNATGIDLAAFAIDGDLGRMVAGDKVLTTPALTSFVVGSMGRFGITTQAPGGDLTSFIKGGIGVVTIRGDIDGAFFDVLGAPTVGIGQLTIGGSIRGGSALNSGVISVAGNIGSATVRGSLIASNAAGSASILAGNRIGALLVDGSLIGGPSEDSGRVEAGFGIGSAVIGGDLVGGGDYSGSIVVNSKPGGIGSVIVGGSLRGAIGEYSGSIYSAGAIGPVTIRGGMFGEGGTHSGSIVVYGNMGPLVVGGDLVGGSGLVSGLVWCGANLASVLVGGSLEGGYGVKSGRIEANGSIGPIKIRGNVLGGDGNDVGTQATASGAILASRIQSVNIGGSLIGGGGNTPFGSDGGDSGFIYSKNDMGPVRIGGDLVGGNTQDRSGAVVAGGRLAAITVGGALRAGYGNNTGYIHGAGGVGPVKIGGNIEGGGVGLASSSIESDKDIASVTIGGSVKQGGTSLGSRIIAEHAIGPILIRGDLMGTDQIPVAILAGGSGLAIKSLTVQGRVQRANILAGYTQFGLHTPDAQIGRIVVAGDWIASNLVASISPGNDGKFGNFDDKVGTIGTNDPNVIASIASVIIRGQVYGTGMAGDYYGICAENVGQMSIGGSPVTLKTGKANDFVLLALASNDVRINEC